MSRPPEPPDVPHDNDFEKLRPVVVRAVAHTCGRFSCARHLEEDFVQECMLRLLRMAQNREERRPLHNAYVYRMAFTVVVDAMRSRRPDVPLDDIPEGGTPVDHRSPETLLSADEMGQHIIECLGCLSDDRRLAVTLYLQGHSVPETADVLGWDKKRADNLIHRGMKDLRRCLTEKEMKP